MTFSLSIVYLKTQLHILFWNPLTNRPVIGQYVTLWSTAPSTFAQEMPFCHFVGVMAQFKLVKPKFLNWTTLHVHLCGLKIIHGMEQGTTCQRTNYHDTANFCLNCFGHMIYGPYSSTYQNIGKLGFTQEFTYELAFSIWFKVVKKHKNISGMKFL